MGAKQEQFLTDELKELRRKINQAVQDARQLERYALALTGVIWTWLLTHDASFVPWFGWWIPFFLCSLGALRAKALFEEIGLLAGYVREREKASIGKAGGWETTVNGRKSQKRRAMAGIVFWLLLLAGTLGGAIWLTWRSV